MVGQPISRSAHTLLALHPELQSFRQQRWGPLSARTYELVCHACYLVVHVVQSASWDLLCTKAT